jgi:hypothetical protein
MPERKEVLYHLEEEMASESAEPSCTPSYMARDILGLKENVSSLTIVDLAAGTSSLVPDLLEEGANAHAVDAIYHLTPEALLQEATAVCAKQTEIVSYYDRRKMWEHGKNAMQKFIDSYRSSRQNYYQAFLTRLPFQDGFADVAVSLNGITAFAEDVDLTLEMINEALRITKPGGKVILSPLHFENDPDFDYYARQHSDIIQSLERKGLPLNLETGIFVPSDIPLPVFNRLTILKP